MSLIVFFKKVCSEFQNRNITFAIAGGMVASFYRKHPRATQDIDVLLFAEDPAEKIAKEIITTLNLEPHVLRAADLAGGPMFAIKGKSTPVCIVAGRANQKKNDSIGLDIILPTMPWTSLAIVRAQKNLIDFGFGSIPCLTPEDILISKFYAIKNQPTRFMDLDDVKSIFQSQNQLDEDYIYSQMKKLNLSVPKSLATSVPKILLKIKF